MEEEYYDKCVSCNEITREHTNKPVDLRNNYIEGAGQLCEGCYDKLYG